MNVFAFLRLIWPGLWRLALLGLVGLLLVDLVNRFALTEICYADHRSGLLLFVPAWSILTECAKNHLFWPIFG